MQIDRSAAHRNAGVLGPFKKIDVEELGIPGIEGALNESDARAAQRGFGFVDGIDGDADVVDESSSLGDVEGVAESVIPILEPTASMELDGAELGDPKTFTRVLDGFDDGFGVEGVELGVDLADDMKWGIDVGQCLAEYFFAIAIGLGGINGGDAVVDGGLDDGVDERLLGLAVGIGQSIVQSELCTT